MRNLLLLFVITLLLAQSQLVVAGRVSVDLGANDLTSYTASDPELGDYYVLRFPVPETIQGASKLDHAFLEFYLDVASREIGGYLEETPLLEVYALKGEFTGEIDATQFEPQNVPTVRNVLAGANRRVVIDITEIVRAYIQNPATNHGLVIGSLTGRRDGLFSVRTGTFGQGSVARITFFD